MSREQRTGVFDLRETPKLEDLLQKLDRNLRVTIRTSTVGAIAASAQQPLGYDPATQLCSVLVQQLTVTVNPDSPQGQASTITQPPVLLVNVPVAWPRTNAGYLTFPLTPGDTGELIIQDRSLSEWRSKGIPVDPVDNWTHNRGDAVFHPGLHPDTNPLPLTDQTATVLEGPPLAGVKLGRAAALGVARLSDDVAPAVDMATWIAQVTAAVSALATYVNAIAPGTVPPITTTPGASIGVISSASTKVQSE
jgi:hypothetical protein